jgi:hypothetical protein
VVYRYDSHHRSASTDPTLDEQGVRSKRASPAWWARSSADRTLRTDPDPTIASAVDHDLYVVSGSHRYIDVLRSKSAESQQAMRMAPDLVNRRYADHQAAQGKPRTTAMDSAPKPD